MNADRREGPRLRRPPAGRPVPTSTYRLQLNADFTLDDAAAQVPYLARLGVTHLYLSPVLTAAPDSTHGYDVVDHDTVSEAMGGRAALDRLSAAAREAGLGLVLDLVPNHMAVPVPVWHNRALWSVLAEGPESPYADWFDVDWSGDVRGSGNGTAGGGALLMPVLGSRIGEVLAAGEISVATETVPGESEPRTVLRYFDHVLPVRAGTENLPLAELLERQHYRLAWWKVAAEELNYRPLLRRRHACRDPRRVVIGVRRDARPRRRSGEGRRRRRAAHRPPRRPRRPEGLPRAPRRANRRRLGRGREDPRPPTRSCPRTGRQPEPPATTRCGACTPPSSTRPERASWRASCAA